MGKKELLELVPAGFSPVELNQGRESRESLPVLAKQQRQALLGQVDWCIGGAQGGTLGISCQRGGWSTWNS